MSEQEQAAWVSRAYTSEDAASAPALKPWVSLMASKEKTSVTKELGRRSPQSLKFLAKGLESSFRGQKIHRLFELLKLSDANLMTTFMNAWFEGELREVQAALEYVRHLKKPPLTEILDGGHAEWSFLVEKEGQVLEGQIDLWGRDSLGRLWIVDYKSGSSAHKAHAFAQLRLYSEALRRADQAKRAETVFVCALFPFESACFVEEISM